MGFKQRPWEEILKNPLLWHFRFGGPDMERLVAGRERIYLDRFWNEFSADPKKFSEASREHYAKLYARPGAIHAGFAQFAAFDQDARDNQALLARGKLKMPVLARCCYNAKANLAGIQLRLISASPSITCTRIVVAVLPQ
jgi:hypothetical protein